VGSADPTRGTLRSKRAEQQIPALEEALATTNSGVAVMWSNYRDPYVLLVVGAGLAVISGGDGWLILYGQAVLVAGLWVWRRVAPSAP
jgi:hypothetical protein